jgi:tetratricopeptide (TPR) repeat protein
MSASPRAALSTLLVLGCFAPSGNAGATPMDPPAREREAAQLLLAPPAIAVDPGAVSVVDVGETPALEGIGVAAPEAGGPAAARPPGEGPASANSRSGPEEGAGPPGREADVAPGSDRFRAALTRNEIDLAARQARQGDFEGAASSLGRALEIDPDQPRAHAELGLALMSLRRFAEAETHLLRALELGQRSAPLHAALAQAASVRGRPADAIRHSRQALQLDPDQVAVANNLAWILATCEDPALRDPAEAIRLAQGALRDTPGEAPQILDTLAAGYAAAGRFEAATRTAERAEALALEGGRPDLARQIRAHLDRYRAGRPWVDSPGASS